MKLSELIEAVKEDNLTKGQLESYHSNLCNLKAELKQEFGSLKKEKAIFMLNREQGESVASRVISWGASKSGQRKFDVESYIGSVNALIEGVKSKLYSIY